MWRVNPSEQHTAWLDGFPVSAIEGFTVTVKLENLKIKIVFIILRLNRIYDQTRKSSTKYEINNGEESKIIEFRNEIQVERVQIPLHLHTNSLHRSQRVESVRFSLSPQNQGQSSKYLFVLPLIISLCTLGW